METTQEQNIFIATNWEYGFLAIDSIFQMYPFPHFLEVI